MKTLRLVLLPLSVLYYWITCVRNWLYDVGLLKATQFKIPVIAVGNLNVGGTGKTPQIEYLIRLLKDDYHVAVLSRGYKRKTSGFIQVNHTHTATDVGDEPLQFYKKFGDEITVAVDANRVRGIQRLLENKRTPDVVLLDDAFQHRNVKAKQYILLTQFNDLYVNDFLLPAGNLRESKQGAKRADIIIVTKCPENLSKEKQQDIYQKLNTIPKQPVFFTTIRYDHQLYGTENIQVHDLQKRTVILITGIANPNPLLQFLSDKQIAFKHLKFPDHHDFSNKDIDTIKQLVNHQKHNNPILLTTEKDYVRLSNKLDHFNYIAIQSAFLTDAVVFDKCIKLVIQ